MQPGDIRTPIALLVVAFIFSVVFLVVLDVLPSPTPAASTVNKQIPPITPTEQAQLQQTPQFQALVSYTDRGFEPPEVTIAKGDTVRFTNNSSHQMWVAATSGATSKLYPQGGEGCGSSAFDSCTPIAPGDFWLFTFNVSGTWSYQNNGKPSDTGVVEVK